MQKTNIKKQIKLFNKIFNNIYVENDQNDFLLVDYNNSI